MYNLIKTELYKLKRQKLFIILFLIVIAISSFSTFSEINLVTPTNPVTGKESFANAFQDIFMIDPAKWYNYLYLKYAPKLQPLLKHHLQG